MLDQMIHLDQSLRLWVVAHRVAWLDGVMWTASLIGRGGLVWLVIGLAITLIRRTTPALLLELTLAIVLASFLADHVMKPLASRERPFVSTPEILVIGSRPDDASFPSGHAANAFAGASVLARRLRAQRVLWWSLALLIAYSRVYLGVHYPLDVIGGALLGFVCGTIAGRVVGATRFSRSVPLPPSRNASEDHRRLGGGG
jgi:undecaprenyl-diphosphatase